MVTGRRLILGNADVRLSYVVAAAPSPLYRNAIGDEMVYIESGEATVETVFGALEASEGDYVLIPMSTTHRWIPPKGDKPLRAYAIERTVTSSRPSAIFPASASCSRTHRSVNETCTDRSRP